MATYTITITQVPSGSGLVKVGSSTVAGNVQEEGVTVNLLATAFSGFTFIDYVVGGDVVSTSSSYSFVMPSNNIEIIVNFATIVPPDTTEQPEIYDTDCPKFYFIKDLTERYFTGDLVDLSASNFVEIEEPIDFDTGKFRLERDPNYHGFNYEFAVDELKYEFDSAGYNYLKDELYIGGTDSDIKFVYGYGGISSFTIFYIGKVDMNTYAEIENGEKITFGLVELDFDNLLQTAFEVPQEVVLENDLLLYSKVIPKRIEYKIEVPEDVFGIGLGIASRAWYSEAYRTPDPPNEDAEAIKKTSPVGHVFFNDGRSGDNDFEDFYTYDFRVNDGYPIDDAFYVLKAKEAGTYDIEVKFWMGMFFVAPSNFTDFSFLELTVVKRNAITNVTLFLEQITPNEILSPTLLLDPDKIAVFDQKFTANIDINDELYCYIRVGTDKAAFPTTGSINSIVAYPFNYDRNIPQLAIIGYTQVASSNSKASSSYDCLNQVCKSATETDYDIVKSDFFSTGCGDLMFLTNGFNIRGKTDRNMFVAPKKLIDMLSNLYCLGWGVEYDDIKRELIAIEPVEYFYRDVEIMSFDSVSDYKKEIDTTKYYNEIEVGFSKYAKQRETDKGFTLDDFHTKHTYQTPIKTNKNKLTSISDLILSAYLIEIIRRKQFLKDGGRADGNYSEDDDIFGLHLSTKTPVETFEYPNEFVAFEEELYTYIAGLYSFSLAIGDVVTYISRAGVSQTRTVTVFGVQSFTILDVTTSTTYIWFAEPLIGATSGSGDVSITKTLSSNLLTPEGSENFEITENLLSPATTFNLRYSPKRILLNWAKLFNGGFFTKAGTDQVVFKQGDGNTSLITKFAESEECLLGDVGRLTLGEGDNLDISVLNGDGSYLYLPIKISFTTSLSFEQLTDLKKCLRGQDDSEIDRNYGYITVADYCGNNQKLFITSIEYSGVTEEAAIEGYLKEL
jgi:hypothetical protein